MADGLIQTGTEYKERALSGMVREGARFGERWMARKKIKLQERVARMQGIQEGISSGLNLAITGVSFGLGAGGGGMGGLKAHAPDLESGISKISDTYKIPTSGEGWNLEEYGYGEPDVTGFW